MPDDEYIELMNNPSPENKNSIILNYVDNLISEYSSSLTRQRTFVDAITGCNVSDASCHANRIIVQFIKPKIGHQATMTTCNSIIDKCVGTDKIAIQVKLNNNCYIYIDD